MIKMAERRMFAKSIVLSDAFLDMPLSARCLYFTFGMLADDDGFVGSPKAIMRQCGASQDDVTVLLQKRYILAFDSGVIVIKHWRMNNYLQKDRHKDTTYLEELNQLAVDERGAYTEADKVMYTKCIQNVYTDKDRLDKDRLDKDRLEEVKDEPQPSEPKKAYYEIVIDMFNDICSSYPKVTKINDKRQQAIWNTLQEYEYQDINDAFVKAEASDFLKGNNGRNWKACFDWIIEANNMLKIIEGAYDNREQPKPAAVPAPKPVTKSKFAHAEERQYSKEFFAEIEKKATTDPWG